MRLCELAPAARGSQEAEFTQPLKGKHALQAGYNAHSTAFVVIEVESILRTLVVTARLVRHVLVGADDGGILGLCQQPGRVEPHGVAAGARPRQPSGSDKGADEEEEQRRHHRGLRGKTALSLSQCDNELRSFVICQSVIPYHIINMYKIVRQQVKYVNCKRDET